MPNRLQNKIAIVTGSSSGLGRAIALLYAKEGASVLCADLRPEAPSYCASKGAVANLTRNIAIDYSKQLIHCNAICPGHVETAIFAETTQNMMTPAEMDKMYPFKGPGRPVDVARMAVVLACEDSSWMTGACVAVDGGFTAR
ncbi:NAD(P)-binding protein [Venturia nashicola]|uniref:NAD(P)-binding protein n=1 Tax=Venturia nashicola TaxID=86259 RepID=A0A4Z1NLE8_9PEZI|nr:NAD(P)-binding protein [Venturia nashicola]